MVGSLISLSRVPLAPAGAEPEPSISLRGDDGTAPGVDSGWPELSDPAAMMNSCPRVGGTGAAGGKGGAGGSGGVNGATGADGAKGLDGATGGKGNNGNPG